MFASKSDPVSTSAPVEDSEEKAGGRVVVGLLLGIVLLVGGAYVVAHQVTGGKVPRGTTVAGVAIGGSSAEEAEQRLRDGLEDRVDQPLELVVGDEKRSVTPAEAGLSVDYAGSIEAAGGGSSWAPERLWTYFTGGHDLDAKVDLDEAAFDGLLDELGEEYGNLPVEGAVTFVDGRIRTTDPEPGQAIDAEVARKAFLTAYLGPSQEVELELEQQQPEIDEADVAAALNDFANAAVSEPVELVFDETTVRLSPRDYSKAIALETVDGVLQPKLRPKQLKAVLADALAGDGGPVEATVALKNGKPVVVPDEPGVAFEQKEVNDLFLDLVAAEPDKRRATVEAEVARSDFRTDDAEALNIKEVVADVTTQFPYAEYRNINIGRAAELINGTVLKPGETFSMNDTVGERTRENGFTEGFMIADGVFKEDLGGGVSQMATTLFNGAFFAGLEDVEHKPHSFYISRYPVGREATVAWGSVDLRFKNDTDHGVLIEAKVTPATPSSQGVVRVRMWSTKVWDIKAVTGDRYNFTPPKTRTMTTSSCVPNSGYGGFEINVKRVFRKAGESKVVRTENFHTTYTPSDTVVCKKP
ncbi:VanW family protein [Nocardioides jishulii]|uniref:Peptidoglycan binding domain-containing protein n=1 Tax=Nocardioides jishulii TaxID=2575440 RepID=A0A4V5TLL4_9ACTN|nr:VanW family protein [Nocardioides jishulii]QCX26757.1 hypothetical protein FCL41_03750 [Nocardioides jishulii]TKI60273.1 hypothetical protein FC770_15800 [Nocardioides jishulii]